MLARKRTAELDHRAKHLLARPFDLVNDLVVAHVEEDVGMQVSVAGVKDIGDGQLVVLADLAHGRKNLRQA